MANPFFIDETRDSANHLIENTIMIYDYIFFEKIEKSILIALII